MVTFESVRPTKTAEDRLESTLDIVHEREVDAHIAQEIVNTGDILLYANEMKHRTARVRWQKIIVAGGGKATVERRLPIIHSAIVIKNPPKDVLEAYGLAPADGKAFAFEASGSSPDGARMMPLKDWVAYELDPSCPGGKVLLRTREATKPFTPPPELWEWLKQARTIPYSAINTEVLFNGVFIEGAYAAVVTAGGDIIMDTLRDKIGDGPLSRTVQGLVGLLSQLLIWLFLALNCIWILLTSWIPYVLRRRKIKNEDGSLYLVKFGGSGRDVPHMFCSKASAETLMHAGILNSQSASSWYLPKDFLPKDIGAKGNLFDERLNDGFSYSDKLIFIVPSKTDSSVSRTSRLKSFLHAVGVKAAHYQDEEDILKVAHKIAEEE